MDFANQLIARFDQLDLRERVLAVVAIALVLCFLVDLVMLSPQRKYIQELNQQEKGNKTELASINKVLASIADGKNGANVARVDPLFKDRAMLKELKAQIAEVDAFVGQADATSFEVGALVREMLDAGSRLTLVSLKTLPVILLYSPMDDVVEKDVKDFKDMKDKPARLVKEPRVAVIPKKPIYRHGVEIGIKGDYMDLLPYLENLQKYPKRLFWYEAKLDVASFPDAVLVLIIYTLSEQSSSPLS